MNKKVYVSIANQGIYRTPYESPWEFELNIERDALYAFEKLFQQYQLLEISNMWRAHLPAIPYHLDKENDAIDIRLMKLYALVHEYGDEKTKEFVEQLPYFRPRH